MPPTASRWKLLAALGVFLPSLSLLAGAPPPSEDGMPLIRTFYRRDFEPKGGEAGPQVFAMAQDDRGVLYFANNLGILEHDGVTWRILPTPKVSVVLSVARDEGGTIWVGTSDDFGRLEPDATGSLRYAPITHLLPKDAPKVKDVWQVIPVEDRVVFRSPTAIFVLDRGVLRVRVAKTSFSIGALVNGHLLVRQPEVGLMRLAGDDLQLAPDGGGLGNEKIYFYLPFDERRVLLGARSGLKLYDPSASPAGERLTPFPTEADAVLSEGLVYCGETLADGTLAIGTLSKGLVVIDRAGRLLRHVTKGDGLADDRVLSLAKDRDGALWACCNDGVSRVEIPAAVSHFGERQGLFGFVESLTRHGGSLYAATSRGVHRLVPEAGRPRFERLPGVDEAFELVTFQGRLLAAAPQSGILEVVGDRLVPASDVRAQCLLPSSRQPDRLLAGHSGGLRSLRLRDGRLVDEGPVDGIPDEPARLEEDAAGTVWIGTESNGVYRLPPEGRPVRYGGESGLPAGFVLPFRLGGEVVFGTKKGLRRFDGATERFPPDTRLGPELADGSRDLFRLLRARDGSVLVRSTGTTTRMRPEGGRYAAAPGPIDRIPGTIEVQSFLVEEDTGVPRIAWIGTRDGLFRADLGSQVRERPPLSVLIRRVSSRQAGLLFGGSAAGGAAGLKLRHEQSDLRVEFAALSFEEPSLTRYTSYLEPYEKTFAPPSEEPWRDYTALREGSYTFHVRAVDLLGRTSAAAAYTFTVLPPWYRSPWAYALWTLAVTGLVAGLLQLRTRQLRRRTRDLEAAVSARTEELAGSNRRLREAEERIARLVSTASEAQEDLQRWAARNALDIAATVGAESVDAFTLDGESLVGLTTSAAPAPDLQDLRRSTLGSRDSGSSSGPRVLPVTGATGQLLGAVVVRGAAVSWGEAERHLVEGFAHQLGGALEMRRMRSRLHAAESSRAAFRADMERRGVALLVVCRSCGRTTGTDRASPGGRCEACNGPLEGPRLLPHRLLDRYRLDRLLGEGGMGTVFMATDERLSRDVAIKVMRPEHFDDPSTRLRFEREAQVLGRVAHPGVVTIFDSGELADGSAYIVMERLRGTDLAAILARRGRGHPAQVARLARQGASALAAAHRAGVVHRDVKPANVVLVTGSDGFVVKLLDFGLARATGAGDALTRTGLVVGTPWYMPPEQMAGLDTGPASDLYSFAAVLYEALTGRRTTEEEDVSKLLGELLTRLPPPPSRFRPGLPARVDEAFESAFVKDPARRPPDLTWWANQLADALEPVPPSERGWPVDPAAEPRRSW